MSLVQLEDLEVHYGKLKALNGVSVSIESGSVGLLGPNGAGKSTLLKTLLGFVPPTKGRIEMFGKSMPGSRVEVRRQLGYMPERAVVSPKISAVNFLTYCGTLFGMSRIDAMERAHEVLNYVGVGENRYRKMETYSTGMLQRAKFAQALIHNPRLLFLDEPTNGLDPEGRIEMLDLIGEVARKRGIAVVLSSHLMPDVSHVCERVVVLKKGEVVAEGKISELTKLRSGLFEIRVRDNQESFVATLKTLGCLAQDSPNGNIRVTTPETFQSSAFFDAARKAETQVRYMTSVRQSLEEVFMEAISDDDKGVPETGI